MTSPTRKGDTKIVHFMAEDPGVVTTMQRM